MSDIGLIILNRLVDNYEKSWERNNKPRNYLVCEKQREFDEYFSNKGFEIRDLINNNFKELENKGYLNLKFDKNNLLTKVYLNIENIDSIYNFLNRDSKIDNYDSVSKELVKLKTYYNNFVCLNYLDFLVDLVNKKKSYKAEFQTIDDLKMYLNGIEAIYNNKENILVRNFSKKIFNDSKYLENNKEKLFKIINKFDNEYDNFDLLIEKYFIHKNPMFSYIKNGLVIKINNQIIDLDKFAYPLNLSSEMIENLEILSCSKRNVITIENLTTFYYFNNDKYICIYLAGFHTKDKEKIISKIHLFNKSIKFYHFGDIDDGGFKIYFDLVEKTGIKFIPYLMDIETIEKYKDNCKKLTVNDIKNLKNCLKDNKYACFNDLIIYMLKYNIKLEQESIDFKDFA